MSVDRRDASTHEPRTLAETAAVDRDHAREGLPLVDVTRAESIADLPSPRGGAEPGCLAIGDVLGRFTIKRLLGTGGMGEVYLCRDPDLDRDVAVKLLRARPDETHDQTRRDRLLREAQAIAKLAHPNVIAVHDVAVWDGRVFLAMEYVRGQTLGRWVTHHAKDWREIVAMFVQAGRGLTAAHRAGLVHRDFKPDNVLVGDDGRARVLDFGIARSTSTRSGKPSPVFLDPADSLAGATTRVDGPAKPTPRDVDQDSKSSRRAGDSARRDERVGAAERSTRDSSVPRPKSGAHRVLESRDDPWATNLTSTGLVIGTPAYMAPEQFTGEDVDARTDQFSFCVALWEALYGERPFPGKTVADLRASVLRGQVAAGASRTAVSAVPTVVEGWLRTGLSVDREQRHVDLDELLERLEALVRPAPAPRRSYLGVLSVTLAAVTGFAVWSRPVDPEHDTMLACTGDEKLLGRSWGPQARRAMEARFAALDSRNGAETWRATDERAQTWVEGWLDARRATCRDTHELHRQSEVTLELRLGCLDGLAREFEARVALWRDADADALKKAVESASSLPLPTLCEDVERLDARSRAMAVSNSSAPELLVSTVPEIKALAAAGRYKQAAELAAGPWDDAIARNDRPAIVLLGLERGRALDHQGVPLESREVLRRTLHEALTIGLTDEATYAAAYLGSVSGVALSKYDEGESYLGIASALLARRSRIDPLSHQVNRSHCHFLNDRGRVDDALPYCNAAIEQSVTLWGEDSLALAGNLHNLANNYILRHDVGTAREFITRGMELESAVLGESHPRVAAMLTSLAAIDYYDDRLDDAARHCQRAVDLVHANVGEDAAEAIVCKITLGTIASARGEWSSALRWAGEVERAAAKLKGEGSSELVFVETIRGDEAVARDAWSEAVQHFQEALETARRTRAPDHHEVRASALALAELKLAVGELDGVAALIDVAASAGSSEDDGGQRVRYHVARARFAAAKGDAEGTDEALANARRVLTETEAGTEAIATQRRDLHAYFTLYERLLSPSAAHERDEAESEATLLAALAAGGTDAARLAASYAMERSRLVDSRRRR